MKTKSNSQCTVQVETGYEPDGFYARKDTEALIDQCRKALYNISMYSDMNSDIKSFKRASRAVDDALAAIDQWKERRVTHCDFCPGIDWVCLGGCND